MTAPGDGLGDNRPAGPPRRRRRARPCSAFAAGAMLQRPLAPGRRVRVAADRQLLADLVDARGVAADAVAQLRSRPPRTLFRGLRVSVSWRAIPVSDRRRANASAVSGRLVGRTR
ncbi:hypothetical protein HBB16_18135 [Pseudonocardia sp. MCCB 268]|nr:hypothetical protein [Pseudonocardia cytotoxica]